MTPRRRGTVWGNSTDFNEGKMFIVRHIVIFVGKLAVSPCILQVSYRGVLKKILKNVYSYFVIRIR